MRDGEGRGGSAPTAAQSGAPALADVLRAVVEGTAGAVADEFLHSLCRHLAAALGVKYAFVSKCVNWPTTRVRTLAFWIGDRFGDNVEYDIDGTPCKDVLAGQTCYFPERIQELFPRDKDLVALDAHSYLGIPLHDSSGALLGHLAVLDQRAMSAADEDLRRSVLRVFAARAAAELERLRTDETLRATQARLEAAVRALSTPILQLWDGVLVLPVIGFVDFQRAAQMMEALLESLVRTSSRFAILDLTGVETVDTATADHLLKIVRAARMLGAQGVITGIRPAVAQTMTSLGIDLVGIATATNVREGLRLCIQALARDASHAALPPLAPPAAPAQERA